MGFCLELSGFHCASFLVISRNSHVKGRKKRKTRTRPEHERGGHLNTGSLFTLNLPKRSPPKKNTTPFSSKTSYQILPLEDQKARPWAKQRSGCFSTWPPSSVRLVSGSASRLVEAPPICGSRTRPSRSSSPTRGNPRTTTCAPEGGAVGSFGRSVGLGGRAVLAWNCWESPEGGRFPMLDRSG